VRIQRLGVMTERGTAISMRPELLLSMRPFIGRNKKSRSPGILVPLIFQR
jgi:hypothetical protein